MSPDKKSARSVNKNTSADKSISIGGDVVDSTVIVGDNNVVTKQTTIIQKFFNIFKSDSETLEQRNRRILLGHVENAWIKGVLDASLHGAALLDLGIKQDPEAVTKYPWAIKKESTDETLPAGTSMLEIFDSIGIGRSLLILGAPGSGKTTMLLELARQLIGRARGDVTEPIPMVFNLASWTEKLTLADWLAQELNNLYSVPRKTAPDWVKGDKLLLLLDGLDEVRQESRAKCVEAINAFRKEHGMTSLAVCSRSQDYANLNTKLSFEGAIEVQPLTQKQITEFFNRYGDEMAGIKQVLEKDSALREMAETPLFLSIMLMAYRDNQDVDILVSQDEKAQRKHLFDIYVERMFGHPRLKNWGFEKRDVLHWLSQMAYGMIQSNTIPYLIENMQPNWIPKKKIWHYKLGLGVFLGILMWISIQMGLIMSFIMIGVFLIYFIKRDQITMIDTLMWSPKRGLDTLKRRLVFTFFVGLISFLLTMLFTNFVSGFKMGFTATILFSGIIILLGGLVTKPINQTTYPGQKIFFSIRNSIFAVVFISTVSFLLFGFVFTLLIGHTIGSRAPLDIGVGFGLSVGMLGGGLAVIQHFSLRFALFFNNLLPWRLVPFLDHCVDLIFLRRVGGGYIFIHRLLMEHFAEMFVDTLTSKGNQK